MNLIYSQESVEDYSVPTIFLAGPTPRARSKVKSWRPAMINEFRTRRINLNLVIPEPRNGIWPTDYLHQVEWEYENIRASNVLIFWIPRSMDFGMPGLTTNVEFGWWFSNSLMADPAVLLGYPPDAEHCRYLAWLYRKKCGKDPVHSMSDIVNLAIDDVHEST